MNGEQLYQLYVRESDRYGVEVDKWDDLDPLDHVIWESMAHNLNNKEQS